MSNGKMNQRLSILLALVSLIAGALGSTFYFNMQLARTTTNLTTTTAYLTTTTVTTTTITRNSTYYEGIGLVILSVKANLTRLGSSTNSSLVFIVEWKNVSNNTIYYEGGCNSALRATIMSSSTAKVVPGSRGQCDILEMPVATNPGEIVTSTDPGPWDVNYVLTSGGRLDTSLALYWSTTPCIVTCQPESLTIIHSFEV
jgi:hypothetical protein